MLETQEEAAQAPCKKIKNKNYKEECSSWFLSSCLSGWDGCKDIAVVRDGDFQVRLSWLYALLFLRCPTLSTLFHLPMPKFPHL